MVLDLCFPRRARGAIVEAQACMGTHAHTHTQSLNKWHHQAPLSEVLQHLVVLSGALWKRFSPFFITTTLILDCREVARGNYFCFLQQDVFK